MSVSVYEKCLNDNAEAILAVLKKHKATNARFNEFVRKSDDLEIKGLCLVVDCNPGELNNISVELESEFGLELEVFCEKNFRIDQFNCSLFHEINFDDRKNNFIQLKEVNFLHVEGMIPDKLGVLKCEDSRELALPMGWANQIGEHKNIIDGFLQKLDINAENNVAISLRCMNINQRLAFESNVKADRELTEIERLALDGLMFRMEGSLLSTCACCGKSNRVRVKRCSFPNSNLFYIPACQICFIYLKDKEKKTETEVIEVFEEPEEKTTTGKTGTWLDEY